MSSCVVFSLGIAAWRYDWLRQLEWKHARSWIIYTLPVAWLSMPAVGALGISLNGPGTGLSWTAIGYAFWEPFIAWGLIAAWLLVFRQHTNRPSGIWTWLNRRSYAVYIIHPVVLVGISLPLRGWAAPALIKFAVTGTLACTTCWIWPIRWSGHLACGGLCSARIRGSTRCQRPESDACQRHMVVVRSVPKRL